MKYWAYINNEILGPYEKEKLLELPVFRATTLICPQTPVGTTTEDWKEASVYPEIAAMLGTAVTPAAEQFKPDTGIPGSEVKSEHSQPVFNAEMPESRLKPLSLHSIDQTPPEAAPHIDGADFQVNHLSGEKNQQETGGQQPAPSFTSSNFDPMSISQIDNRAEGFDTHRQETQMSTEAVSAQDSEKQASPADKEMMNGISSRLEALTRNSLTRQDIEPLKDKLGQMGEVLSSIKASQFQREVMDKIQYLENAVSEIKASLAQAPAAASPKMASERVLAPAEQKAPPESAKQEIIDQGSSGKKSTIAWIIKKIFKLFITLILLAAVVGGAAFALKNFGVFDVTKFIPFPVPFLSASRSAETPAAPQPFQAVAQTPAQQTPAPQAEPAKRDLTPEIIFIGRTFETKTAGVTLETRIYEDAQTRNGNFNIATWQAKELPNGLFELNAIIPLADRTGQLVYSYEVDYAKKTVQSLDAASAKPLNATWNVAQDPKQNKPQIKKGRQGTGAAAVKGRQPKPAAKPAAKPAPKSVTEKPADAADEEYEYVYEDETGATEE
ncbi:MAG: hypothetical protein WCK75_02440 [Elusimicrobiota bacterium]